jgi:hypothetical protein
VVAASGGVEAMGRSRGGQIPACGNDRPQGAAGINVIVQIIERCSSGAAVVEHIIRLAVLIEIGRSQQLIAACNRRPKGAADIHCSRQIIDATLVRRRVKESVVRLPVPIKIRYAG